jgi:methyl-accepting chemotaxis protein
MNSPRSASNAPCAKAQTAHGRHWPIGVALLACTLAAVPMLGSVTAYTVAPFVAQCFIATAGAWALLRRAPAGNTEDTHRAERTANMRPWSQLLQDVLPVWHQHVVSSRTQIEEAVTDLVASFGRITDEFEAAGFKGAVATVDEPVNATSSLLAMCERDLRLVVSALSEITRSKGEMTLSMGELADGAKDLQAMAHGVAQIAAQTNLLAINAAIEAAHAGDSGRSFATIAKEIRVLSQLSAQTASQITERIARVTKIMHDTSEVAAKASEQEETIVDQSSQAVHGVLTHMRQLSEDSESMRERGNAIRGDIEQLMVSMQFQDRVSQVLTVVDGDIARLKEQAERDEPVPDSTQWLQELQGHYTMREQHQAPSGGVHATSSKAPSKAVYF